MNVHYIIMQFPCPSETFAGSDIRALTQQGANITVHELSRSHPSRERMLADWGLGSLDVRRGGIRNWLKGLGSLLFVPKELFRLLRMVLSPGYRKPSQIAKGLFLVPRIIAVYQAVVKEMPDVVHAFWGHYPALVVGLMNENELKGIVRSTFLGAYDLEQEYKPGIEIARTVNTCWTHATVNLPHLERLQIENTRVVHRGIDLDRLGHSDCQVVPGRLLCVGRLDEHKGQDEVIRVFSELGRLSDNYSLIIIGGGPFQTNLEALARDLDLEEKIIFVGQLDHSEVVEYLWSASGLLHFSTETTERLPNVLKEAMATGTICFSRRTPGIDELLENEISGWIFDDQSADEIAKTVHQVLSGSRADSIRRVADERIRQNFDLQLSMSHYLQEWRCTLAEKRES